MNTQIDSALIQQLHPDLSDEDLKKLVENLQDELDRRMTDELASFMDEEAIKELVALTKTGNEQAVGQWIAAHVPDYEEIVQDEYDILMGEFANDPSKFLMLTKA